MGSAGVKFSKISWEEFSGYNTEKKVEFFNKGKDIYDVLISQQFDRPFLEKLSEIANTIRKIAKTKEGMVWLQSLLPHKRAMLYFIQPSTRTFLSFMNACHILGMRVSEVRDSSTSSEVKGETPEDTIRTFSSYTDVIIMRHPSEGFAEKSAWVLNNSERPVPVINAGSGKDQHPTQALLDIYTLRRSFENIGGIDGKSIVMVGDLMRGRTVRSLSYLLTNYSDVKIFYVSPSQFRMREDIKSFLSVKGVDYREVESLEEVLSVADAIYMTRIQDEHDLDGESETVDYKGCYLTKEHLALIKEKAVIMHPLPRRNEIDPDIDNDPRAVYWRQERNGMWIRAALLIKTFDLQDTVMNYGC